MQELSENKKGIIAVCKFFGVMILVGGVVYSEILFLGIVSSLFPEGAMRIGATLGAITTGASILVLLLAKSHWFRPGTQLIVAWIFTLTEISILIMNDMLAYQIHTGVPLDGYMSMWRLFCVAAPVVSVIGWILCFYFDPQRAIEHKRMEMIDKHERAEIDFQAKVNKQVLAAKYKASDMVGTKLEEKIETQLNYHLEKAAAKFAAKVASEFIGEQVSHMELMGNTPKQIPGRKVVEGTVEPAKAASRDAVIDPHKVKGEIDAEKKDIKKTSKLFDFSIPGKKTQKIETEEELSPPPGQEETEEETEEATQDDESYPQPETWSDENWMQFKEQVDAWEFEATWREYRGDEPIPGETPKKKGKGVRKQKNAQASQGETEQS